VRVVVRPGGRVRLLYQERLDLGALNGGGAGEVRRASHVEPDAAGRWVADLEPAGGPRLGPFAKRSEALAAEAAWLEANHL
jgi:hypothetical protein